MRISHHESVPVANEAEVLDELLRLDGASVLDLGCGKADKTRLVAQRAAPLLGHEVNETQRCIVCLAADHLAMNHSIDPEQWHRNNQFDHYVINRAWTG